jgi:hypothetical protein
MRHVTLAHTSVLIGDEAADLLLDYAALVAQLGRGDSVRLNAVAMGGGDVSIGVLLNSGSSMLVESSACALPEPENALAVAYLRSKLAQYDVGTQWEEAGAAHPHLGIV